MSTDKNLNKLQKFDKKLAQIEAQKERLENQLKGKRRKEDTRRKILVGAWAIDLATREGNLQELYKKVSAYLIRETDKKLF